MKSSAVLRLKGYGYGQKYKDKREHDNAKKAGHISALLLNSSYSFSLEIHTGVREATTSFLSTLA